MKDNEVEHTRDVHDFLEEILNVSFGSAISVIADLMGTSATLHLPEFQFVSPAKLASLIQEQCTNNSCYFTSSQRFYGGIDGETLFILGEKSTYNLARHLDEYDEDEEMTHQHAIDSSVEITNLLTSTCIRSMAQFIDSNVLFSQPITHLSEKNNVIKEISISEHSDIIVIKTMLELKKEQVKGDFYILFSDETISKIEQKAVSFCRN